MVAVERWKIIKLAGANGLPEDFKPKNLGPPSMLRDGGQRLLRMSGRECSERPVGVGSTR